MMDSFSGKKSRLKPMFPNFLFFILEKGGSIMLKFFSLNDRVRKAQDKGAKSFVVTGLPKVFPESGAHMEWDPTALKNIEEIPGHIALVQ